MLAKEAGRQRNIALDVIEKAGVHLRQHERDSERADLCRPAAARPLITQIRECEMHAFGSFRTHSLIVAQDTIDRGHADASPTRNHRTSSRHGSPPVPSEELFCFTEGSFF